MAREKKDITEVLERYYPAVFIGIGGCGTTIVSTLRQKITEKFRTERPDVWQDVVDHVFQFICIDAHGLGPESRNIPPTNFYYIGGFDGRSLVRTRTNEDPNFNRWWPHPYKSVNIDAGCSVRANGRLALLNNLLGGPTVIDGIRTACANARNINAEQVMIGAQGARVNVYIFCSMCGGTGSGIFIDLAYYIRDQLGDPNSQIHSYLVTPEVMELLAAPAQRMHIRAKAYATLTELNFWQTPTRTQKYTWWVGRHEVLHEADVAPFNAVHIFDSTNDTGRTIGEFGTLMKLIADVVFYEAVLPAAAQGVRGALFDGMAALDETGGWKGWPVKWGSACVAILRFPIEKVISFMAMDLLPAIVREYIMKEPLEEAKVEAEDFITKKAAITPEAVQGRMTSDPNFPRHSRRYRQKLEVAGKKQLEKVYRDACSQVKRSATNLRQFFEGIDGEVGKRDQLAADYDRRLNEWVNYCLFTVVGLQRVGLTAQALERVRSYIASQVQPAEERGGRSLMHKLNGLKADEKEGWRRAENALTAAMRANMFTFKARKEDLAKQFGSLFKAVQDRVVLEETIAFYRRALERTKRAKAAVKLVRDILNRRVDHWEGEKSKVWPENSEYDNEHGGLVVEVVDERWANEELRRLSESDEFKGNVFEPLTGEVVAACCETIRDVVKASAAGETLAAIQSSRTGDMRERMTRRFNDKIQELVAPRYERMSVWDVLVNKAKKQTDDPEDLGRILRDEMSDFASKVSPWWPIPDNLFKEKGLYEAGCVHKVGMILCDGQAYRAFKKEYNINLQEILGMEAGNFPDVENNDPHTVQIVAYKYGAPVKFLSTSGAYREGAKHFRDTFDTPIFGDSRFGKEFRFRDPWAAEDTEEEKDAAVAFVISERIALTGEDVPRIKVGNKRLYTFDLPKKYGISSVTIDGRSKAHEAWRKDEYPDGESRTATIYGDLKEFWNGQSESNRRRMLEDCRDYVGGWLKETGTKSDLAPELKKDLKALNEKLEKGPLTLS